MATLFARTTPQIRQAHELTDPQLRARVSKSLVTLNDSIVVLNKNALMIFKRLTKYQEVAEDLKKYCPQFLMTHVLPMTSRIYPIGCDSMSDEMKEEVKEHVRLYTSLDICLESFLDAKPFLIVSPTVGFITFRLDATDAVKL